METGDYLPNSNKAKEVTSTPPAEPTDPGNVTRKKRSNIGRMAEGFISKDVGDVKSYIVANVLMPAVKKAASDTVATIAEMVKSGVNTLLFGEAGRNLGTRDSNSRMTPYGSYYSGNSYRAPDPRQMDIRVPSATRVKTGYNYDDVLFDDIGAAHELRDQMDDVIAQYGLISVATMYELAKQGSVGTDNKYGWTDIRSAEVVRVGPKYMVKLPRALPFD